MIAFGLIIGIDDGRNAVDGFTDVLGVAEDDVPGATGGVLARGIAPEFPVTILAIGNSPALYDTSLNVPKSRIIVAVDEGFLVIANPPLPTPPNIKCLP